MNTWYELTPADTLFFRGSEPLEAGQLSRAALFPPPVTVLQGAIRTAVLKRHGVSFADVFSFVQNNNQLVAAGARGTARRASARAALFAVSAAFAAGGLDGLGL